MNKIIGLLVGSLRKESYSKKLANALIGMAPKDFEFRVIAIDNLPLYNQDFDDFGDVPEPYITFREAVAAVNGVIFVTPEYNRSVPGVLKNALDVGSRPKNKNVWNGKPGAVFSNSPGNISAFGANHHLRQCLTYLNVPVMQQPEVYIAGVNQLFDENGNLKAGTTKDHLQTALIAYIGWFNKFA
ncbi:MAG TPA: NAD(P)H-dependent oxidoreductase [Puia sp.]|nr:NAD(P)H-dependent oxidoreductase [Puia sp.]